MRVLVDLASVPSLGIDCASLGSMKRRIALFTVMIITLAGPWAASVSSAPGTVGTLTILAEPVHYRAVSTREQQPGREGMNLAEGDAVVTGPQGSALITFLDGSTVTVEPASEVVVKQVEQRQDESRVRVLILVGKVWARVAELVGRQSSLSLESNAHAATARDGLIGAESRPDGTFTCWTRRGKMTVRDAAGNTLEVVAPGNKLTLVPRKAPRTETFRVQDSTLEITASPNVLPLVQMPDGYRLAGWSGSDAEVNYVFGSLTAATGDGRSIEVPAGRPGAYTVSLVGRASGPFAVTLVGRFQDRVVYRHRVTGTIEVGEQLRAHVLPHFKEDTVTDATSARVMGAVIEPFRRGARAGASGAVTWSH
jgi:FecR protein